MEILASLITLIAAVDSGTALGAGLAAIGGGIGIGVLGLGAGRGIGNIGGNATAAVARQPEAAGQILVQMIISAALIEGFTFFGIVVAGGFIGNFFG
ncbi:F0F1 ATP synthase subunit C [Algisphaera agarilytica]|uniref:ATP synthase subunit c n=1 Tax=Algisphaera agarilytica TaxID=1385975 RepID=A0A7X0H716_9BACT|nr:F0F1 ATP synthase subunit C [Algisphaera agarilytica]MBB6430414.1 F-type H+-transporting ATPase subunit c [Algisphaera agarilytica]